MNWASRRVLIVAFKSSVSRSKHTVLHGLITLVNVILLLQRLCCSLGLCWHEGVQINFSLAFLTRVLGKTRH